MNEVVPAPLLLQLDLDIADSLSNSSEAWQAACGCNGQVMLCYLQHKHVRLGLSFDWCDDTQSYRFSSAAMPKPDDNLPPLDRSGETHPLGPTKDIFGLWAGVESTFTGAVESAFIVASFSLAIGPALVALSENVCLRFSTSSYLSTHRVLEVFWLIDFEINDEQPVLRRVRLFYDGEGTLGHWTVGNFSKLDEKSRKHIG